MGENTFQEPNYAFWDTVKELSEWHVICLWCDIEPTLEASFCVKAQVIQKKLTRARMAHDLASYVEREDYPNRKSDLEIYYYRDDLKDYASSLEEMPNFLLSKEERSQKSRANKEHDEPVIGYGATTPEDCCNKWEIPERLEYIAREIGQKWMDEQRKIPGENPGVVAIAKYVAKELKSRNLTGPREDYWSWETIKREALSGITERKVNGKK